MIKNRQRKIPFRRQTALLLTGALLAGLLPVGLGTGAGSQAAEQPALRNPRILKTTQEAAPGTSGKKELKNPTMENGITTWDCIWFGNYWQEDTNGDGKADKNDEKTPIKWRVLSVEGDDVFLLADKNLDCQRYNDTNTDVTWETCTMRSWLNGYGAEMNKDGKDYRDNNFLNNAFSEAEQSAIKTTNVVNNDNPEYGTEGGNNTSDKVYLLSIDEVKKTEYGFASSGDTTSTRQAVNTAYTAGGGEIGRQSMGSAGRVDEWWLRSPGDSSDYASNMYINGFVYTLGVCVLTSNFAARPALHINLSSASGWSYAGTVTSDEGETVVPAPTPSAPKPASYDFKVDYIGEDSKKAKTGQIPVKFDEKELKNSSKQYNHKIAVFCAALSTLAYDIRSGYEKTLWKMGYESDNMVMDTAGDSICYGLANKRIYLDGKETDIVLVVLRGTYNMEWLDNFDPGLGKTHKGFQKGADAAYNALEKYVADKKIGQDGRRTKIIVTGHSRGAAVANLLGKEILDKGHSFLTDAGDLFDYSFATPNSTSSEERKEAKYNGIFSIVNPEDFVTKVMLSKNWNYGRYGRTLVLPSSSTDGKKWYSAYLEKLQGRFHEYRPHDNYRPYLLGMTAVSRYVNEVAWTVPNVSGYYRQVLGAGYTYFDGNLQFGNLQFGTLKKLYTCFLGYNQCNNPLYEALSYATIADVLQWKYGLLGEKTVNYFIMNQALDPKFKWAHLAETYLAAMNTLAAEDLYKDGRAVKRAVKHGIVNCPVDVSICNGDGEVVAAVENNEIVKETEGEGVNLSVTGDSKQFWISGGEDYTVSLTGNDTGTMDYILAEEDADSGETQRVVYKSLPVQDGAAYTSELAGSGDIAETVLMDDSGNAVDSSEKLEEDQLGGLSITVQVEGVGTADSWKNLSYGDCVVLSAATDANNTFLGWYDSQDNLISKECEYPVVVTESRKYTAKFTETVVPPESVSLPDKLVMSAGDMEYLAATVLPENATCSDVVYESGDENIVSVTEDGILEAKGIGKTTITVKSLADATVSAECQVQVGMEGPAETQKPGESARPDETTNPAVTQTPPAVPVTSPAGSPVPGVPTKEPAGTQSPSVFPPVPGTPSQSGTPSVMSSAPQPGTSVAPAPGVSPEPGKAAVGKVSALKLKQKKGTVTASWKKLSGAKGYQICYSTSKKWKGKKLKLVTKNKAVIKKLKKKKTYYFRVRAYRLEGAKKVYGAWSGVKKMKIKK